MFSFFRRFARPLSLVSALVTIGFAFSARASVYGELMVHPTRIVFEGNKRAAQVELINNGKTTVTYRVSFVNKRMTDSGHFETVPPNEPGRFAEALVRYSPRQITVAPGASQIIRLSLHKPSGLTPGEYRSHLSIQTIPPARAASDAATPEGSFSVQLIPVFGLTIPVIVREGALSARVSITDVGFRPLAAREPELLRLKLRRDGSRSVYGDVVAYFKSAKGGERVVAQSNGVAVYSPNTSRTLFIPLTESSSRFRGGSLRIVYREQPGDGGRTLAEQTVNVK